MERDSQHGPQYGGPLAGPKRTHPELEEGFSVGILVSLFLHLLFGVIAVIALESSSAGAIKPPEVFTVTLEGGTHLGGINQAPKSLKQENRKKALPATKAPPPAPKAQKTEQAKVEAPSAVEERKKAEKQAAEKKAKEVQQEKIKIAEQAKKKAAEKQKREAEQKKKAQQEAAKKAAEQAKAKAEKAKQALEAKKKADAEKKVRDDALREKRLNEAISRSKERYDGESYDSGGQGFGAARTGGKGMGGGSLASLEFIRYRNSLESYIKSGWHWLPGSEVLQSQVVVRLLPSGVIQDVLIANGSGNAKFDDSVVRAIRKSSPVPAPPKRLYNQFREVKITFNSHN